MSATISNIKGILTKTTTDIKTTAEWSNIGSKHALEVIEAIRNKMVSRVDFGVLDGYLWELTALAIHQNPKPSSTIDYVWVLSARATYLKNKINNDPLIKDMADDYNRVQLGVKIAREVTAMRARKTLAALVHRDFIRLGPTIIYNGRPEHNHDLQNAALATGTIQGYPIEKFTILALEADKLHTGGQFLSVRGAKLPLAKVRHFAVVTHAYHWMRVSRMFDHPPISCFDGSKGFAFLVDRQLIAPGANLDVEGEVERIPKYIGQGIIARDPTKRITDKRQHAMDDNNRFLTNNAMFKTRLIQFNIYLQTKFPEIILNEVNQFLGQPNNLENSQQNTKQTRAKRCLSLS